MNWQVEVTIAAVVAGLVELVLHWFPWRLLLGRELPRLAAYVLGVVGMVGPLYLLFWHWWDVFAPSFPLPGSEMDVLAAVPQLVLGRVVVAECWVIGSAGGAVMLAYGLDWVMVRVRRSAELQEILDERQAE